MASHRMSQLPRLIMFSVNGSSFSSHSRWIAWYSLNLSCRNLLTCSGSSSPSRVDGKTWPSMAASPVRMTRERWDPSWLLLLSTRCALLVALYRGEFGWDCKQQVNVEGYITAVHFVSFNMSILPFASDCNFHSFPCCLIVPVFCHVSFCSLSTSEPEIQCVHQ